MQILNKNYKILPNINCKKVMWLIKIKNFKLGNKSTQKLKSSTHLV